jgi:hypothetical protein
LQQETEDEELTMQQAVYYRLDKIVQSSALVECINSILRPTPSPNGKNESIVNEAEINDQKR